MITVEQEDWVRLIALLLRRWPFPADLRYADQDPGNNEWLLAGVDLERCATCDAVEIERMLNCTGEGWCFRGRAEYLALEREFERALGG